MSFIFALINYELPEDACRSFMIALTDGALVFCQEVRTSVFANGQQMNGVQKNMK